MRLSKSFSKTSKTMPAEEASINAQLLIKAGYVDKLMAGAYTLLPLGFKVVKKIEQIIREEIEKIDGQEIFMPALHPKENWTKTGRWDAMDDLFQLKLDNDKQFALGATHEEIISPLAKRFINSYKDLPKYVFQFQDKFRNELRAKSGLLRGREFMMKDLYSFHADQADLDDYYEKAKTAYAKIFERCGIGEKTYLTYASGGSFAKYSHEYQTLTSAGEDIIYICDKCRIAINKEIIIDLESKCPECGGADLHEEKSVETGNIFKLGTKYSEPFNLTYKNQSGEENLVIMGCYGIGLQRLMATIVEINNDDRGIIWPKNVAPYLIQLASLGNSDNVSQNTEQIYNDLLIAKFEVINDDREAGAGEKLADADLIGCPYRIIVSEKTLKDDCVEIKKRNSKEIEMVKIDQVLNYFNELGK